jgi:hypothetical protein
MPPEPTAFPIRVATPEQAGHFEFQSYTCPCRRHSSLLLAGPRPGLPSGDLARSRYLLATSTFTIGTKNGLRNRWEAGKRRPVKPRPAPSIRTRPIIPSLNEKLSPPVERPIASAGAAAWGNIIPGKRPSVETGITILEDAPLRCLGPHPVENRSALTHRLRSGS